MIDDQIPQSPKFVREERRRTLWAGITGLVLGLAALSWGIDGMRTGEWVSYGRMYSSLELPGWVVTLIGLFLLFVSGWILLRLRRKA